MQKIVHRQTVNIGHNDICLLRMCRIALRMWDSASEHRLEYSVNKFTMIIHTHTHTHMQTRGHRQADTAR